jgi:lysine-N-methylase
LQNWDCHVCGTCCKEYLVTITQEEKDRIESQGWDRDRDLGGRPPVRVSGPPWARRYHLNHQPDGSCVFLDSKGRCRVHERHGYETKPLPCRLFPFVLVPQGDRWGVGLRFACPSAAENKGRPLTGHNAELREFADMLARREGLSTLPDGTFIAPPRFPKGQIDWPDTHRYKDALLAILGDRNDRMERRWRRCLALATQCRGAPRIDAVKGQKLGELLGVLAGAADAEVPTDPASLAPPGWIGRILFRQTLALYTRKDHGPNRGLARRGRVALSGAALRFARGKGAVPRMHRWMPETTFEAVESAGETLTPAAEAILERYYLMKVGSLQFCGAACYGMSFWEGLEALALTFPILLWVRRAFADLSPEEGVTKALSIVDDHFGFNRVLGSLRHRFSLRLLAGRGEIVRLIAWYSRG